MSAPVPGALTSSTGPDETVAEKVLDGFRLEPDPSQGQAPVR